MRPKASDSKKPSLTSLGSLRSPAPAHVVELLVLCGPGHRSALVLQRLPQGFRPVPDPRPHPPEVLLGHLAEGPVGLIRRDLLGRVVEDEDRRSEPVLELVVHRNPPLSASDDTRRRPREGHRRPRPELPLPAVLPSSDAGGCPFPEPRPPRRPVPLPPSPDRAGGGDPEPVPSGPRPRRHPSARAREGSRRPPDSDSRRPPPDRRPPPAAGSGRRTRGSRPGSTQPRWRPRHHLSRRSSRCTARLAPRRRS